jgi:hypothetical protein
MPRQTLSLTFMAAMAVRGPHAHWIARGAVVCYQDIFREGVVAWNLEAEVWEKNSRQSATGQPYRQITGTVVCWSCHVVCWRYQAPEEAVYYN